MIPYALGPRSRATVATEAMESTCRPTVERLDQAVPETALCVRLRGVSVDSVGAI